MRNRLVVVLAAAAVIIVAAGLARTARDPGPDARTPWGEPDLQGIWTDPYQTPLERPAHTATDFGNEGGTDALTGNGGGIFQD